MTALKDVKVLVVDDNALILDLLMKGLAPHCNAYAAADGADALLKIVDEPPDLIVCDYRMSGLDGRQLYEKLRARQQTKQIPFIFLASRGDVEEKLRPMVDGVEEFVVKPFFVKDLIRRTKKVIDRLALEKLQSRAVRPGVIQGRLEEMSILDLMQSLEMGQKSCRLTIRHDGEVCELFFSATASAPMPKLGSTLKARKPSIRWSAGPPANLKSTSTSRPSGPRFPAPPRACLWKRCA